MKYSELIELNPADRVAPSGDELTDIINGILVAFAYKLKERNGWIDIITLTDAEKEIRQLIDDQIRYNR